MGSRIVRKALQIGMSQTRNLDGVFAVHKPANITSADVLRDLQKQFNPSKFFQPWIDGERARRRQESKFQQRRRRDKRLEVKLGHGGTLDPMATGVLITGVGKGTKSLNNFLKCTKTYETVVLFGVATDSYDRVGKLVSRAPYEHVTREMVEKALEQFRGKIMQRPSIFSALKVQGKKLYEYAREGIEPPVEILKRPVEVSNLEIMEWYEPGTHDYVWPTEEASENEKSIALKMRAKDLGTTTSAETETGERPSTSHAEEHGQKRKTPPAEEPRDSKSAEQPSSSPKRQKTVPEEISTDESLLTSDTPAEPSAESPPKPPAVKLTMTVSSGFYVRSLAHDLGLALNSNAIMSSLVRSRQGDFDLAPEHVLEYKDLEGGEDVWGPKLQGFLDDWAEKRPSNESDKSDVEEGIKDTRNEKEG